MDWERFILSMPVAVAVLAVLAGASMLAAGLGYRKLSTATAITFCASVAASVGFWFVGLLVGLALATPGEGAGVALLVFSFLLAGLAGLFVLLVGSVWIVWKRDRYLARTTRSSMFVALAVLLFWGALTLAAVQFVRVTPALMSGRALSGQASGLNGPLRAEAREALLARGQDAVPAVLEALRRADRSDAKVFESGLNLDIMYQLELLGELGGPDAVAELRTWFNSDVAPDIRATAARGLGAAGDAESAHAIAVLLDERSYEWRTNHFQLLRALTLLKAKDELSHVKSAMQFTADEEGSSFQIGLLGEGIQALAAFDTPEAWQTISEVANAGGLARKEAVERILRDMDKTLPVATAPSADGTP